MTNNRNSSNGSKNIVSFLLTEKIDADKNTMQKGELPDGRDCYFRMVNGVKLPWKMFTNLFIPRDKLDQKIEPGDSIYCLVLDCDKKSANDLRIFGKVNYKYLRLSNLNKPATDDENKKYGKSLHRLRGEVYDFIACYDAGGEGVSIVQDLYSTENTRVKSRDDLPLIGWIIILHDTVVDDEAKYAWGCDGMSMTLVSFDHCAHDGDKIIDLESFPGGMTEIFNYIEYNMRPDISGLDKEQVERTSHIFHQDLPFLTAVDYYGHTILPCRQVEEDFLFIENDARNNGNRRIEKLAHDAYIFLKGAFERHDEYSHCLCVRFDGM